jgi:hypothetical protein
LEIIDLSAEHSAMVRHAVDLFAAADLELPPVVVRGGDPTSGCSGHDGLHHARAGFSEIDLCLDGVSPAVMHTVLHEFAHAWSVHALQPQRRAAFQDLREFDVWQAFDKVAWEENGSEQAAEIIAWGVQDEPASTIRITDDSCSDLRAGYLALTGAEPLHGLTEVCANSAPVTRS